jgi:carbon monoxide dehydrogenase subunit G
MSFRESIVIRVSPEAAFAYLGDPSTATEIDPAVISYEPDTVPMGVGTRNKVRFRMFGLRMKMYSEVLEWEVGRRMVIRSIKPRRPVVGTATHSFEPHKEGTLYTWAMEVEPTMPGGWLFARLFTRFMRDAARKQQRRFKEIMERR